AYFLLFQENSYVFLNACLLVKRFLGAKIVSGTGEADLASPFWSAHVKLSLNSRLAAMLREDPEVGVRLRGALEHEPGRLGAAVAAGRMRDIEGKPAIQPEFGAAMVARLR